MEVNSYNLQLPMSPPRKEKAKEIGQQEIIDARTGKPISVEERNALSQKMLSAKMPTKEQASATWKFLEKWSKKYAEKPHKVPDINKMGDNISVVLDMVDKNNKKQNSSTNYIG